MKKLLFLIIFVALFGCKLTYENQKQIEASKFAERQLDCEFYNENIHTVKYDFWDTETNNKIDKCLRTSENIEFYNITNDRFRQQYPSVSGNFVVWEDYSSETGDIFLYDIQNKKQTRVTSYEGENFKPIVRSNFILFHKQYEGDLLFKIPKDKDKSDYWRNELFLYDIKNSKFIQLANHIENMKVTKGSFDGNFLVTGNMIYDIRDRINRDPNRVVTLKSFNPEGGGGFYIVENNSLKEVGFSKDKPEIKIPIKFVPFDIQVNRKRNWDPIVGFSGIAIMDDPTPPNIKRICNADTCDDITNRDPSIIDCLHSEKLCKVAISDLGFGRIPKHGYLLGGTILKIDNGEYYKVPPYKQVKNGYALDYKLRWGLENLALVNLSGQKPLFYEKNVQKEILIQFDPIVNIFNVCLKMHKGSYGEPICDKMRNFVRIYDFNQNKFFTIKGNLWEFTENGPVVLEIGDFDLDNFAGNSIGFTDHGFFDDDKFGRDEIDFNDNKLVWAFNNEEVINGVSNYNTDIKLAIINN